MPRRPRPASRRPPQHELPPQQNASKPRAPGSEKTGRRPEIQVQELNSDEGSSGSGDDESFDQESGIESRSDLEDEFDDIDDAEPDAPRVAQWVDEEELDGISAEDSEEDVTGDELDEVDGTRLVCFECRSFTLIHASITFSRRQTCIPCHLVP